MTFKNTFQIGMIFCYNFETDTCQWYQQFMKVPPNIEQQWLK